MISLVSFMHACALQDHPEPKRSQLGTLKESMIEGTPFPKLHAKAAETKELVLPVCCALEHFRDQDASKQDHLDAMVKLLQTSHSIDTLVADIKGYKPTAAQGAKLVELVQSMNVGIAKLCHTFMKQGLFLFNFVPKNHYLYHLADCAKHMSPRVAWCYQGEDLMHKVKTLAQGSFRGCSPQTLCNKVMAKYLIGLSYALSE